MKIAVYWKIIPYWLKFGDIFYFETVVARTKITSLVGARET
jgi:hypothetical protein